MAGVKDVIYLDSAGLARMHLDDMVVDAISGYRHKGEGIPDFNRRFDLKDLRVPDGDEIVEEILLSYTMLLMSGVTPVGETWLHNGKKFGLGDFKGEEMKEEMIKIWELFLGLPQSMQETYVQGLLAWVEGSGQYPQQIGK